MEDVFIVGGGASGLFSACELARHGVRARIVDRESEPHHQPRATAIEPATLEMFARAGVINEFLRFAVHVHQSRVCGPGLLTLTRSSFTGIDCAYEFQCCLPQWRTEEILLAHLERLGSSVEQGTTVTSVEQVDDHLLLTLERADSGRETVGARYLIGAGGARSITRSSMRERLEGETYAGRYVVADARLALPVAPGEGTVVVSPKGFVLFGPLPGVLKPVVARYQGKVSRIYFRADAAFAMPEGWSLTTLKDKLIKIGAKVVSHGRYVIFQMAEVAIARQMFQEILRLIAELRPQPPPALA